jgi:ABC-2 type transport system ATP-binding protein
MDSGRKDNLEKTMTYHKQRMPAVLLHNITVRRGDFTLAIPELRLQAGKVVCIVGPNGCGKTTLLLSLLGLLPHEGTCYIGGKPYDGTDSRMKALIGFIPDDPELLFAELTAREQWSVTASVLAGMQRSSSAYELLKARAETLAASIGFAPPAQLAREYSHGMRKKTQIVQALLGRPAVIVIDELRNGLDPIAIRQTEQLIRKERIRGAAICAATHDLWWAERFADLIVVLHEGCIRAQGTVQELLEEGEADLETAFHRIVGATI